MPATAKLNFSAFSSGRETLCPRCKRRAAGRAHVPNHLLPKAQCNWPVIVRPSPLEGWRTGEGGLWALYLHRSTNLTVSFALTLWLDWQNVFNFLTFFKIKHFVLFRGNGENRPAVGFSFNMFLNTSIIHACSFKFCLSLIFLLFFCLCASFSLVLDEHTK